MQLMRQKQAFVVAELCKPLIVIPQLQTVWLGGLNTCGYRITDQLVSVPTLENGKPGGWPT